jgi:hypothetical protein
VSYEHVALQYIGADGIREVCRLGFEAMPGFVRWDVPNLQVIVRNRIAIAWGLNLSLANIASGQKSLTFAQRRAILHTMREAFGMVVTLWSALATRRDLILEYLALRHQLGVLARSDRRFRPSDGLFWLCLRRYANFQNMPTRPARIRWQAARGMTGTDASGGLVFSRKDRHDIKLTPTIPV